MPVCDDESKQQQQQEGHHVFLSASGQPDAGLRVAHQRSDMIPNCAAESDVASTPQPCLIQRPNSTVELSSSSAPVAMMTVAESSFTESSIQQRSGVLQWESHFNWQMSTPTSMRPLLADEADIISVPVGSKRRSLTFERASMATLVFTRNAEESHRKSPPLKNMLNSNKSDDEAADSSFVDTAALHGGNGTNSSSCSCSRHGVVAVGDGSSCLERYFNGKGHVEAQEAEQLDLQTPQRFLGGSRHVHFVQKGVGPNEGYTAAVDTCAVCSFAYAHGASMSHTHMSPEVVTTLNRSPPLRRNDAGDMGHNAHPTVKYEFRKLRGSLCDVSHSSNGEEDSDSECACSFLDACCGALRCCRDREDNSEEPPSVTGGTNVQQDQRRRRRRGPLRWMCWKVARLWCFLNIFTADFLWPSRMLCLMSYISGVIVTLVTFLLLWTLLSVGHKTTVRDGSVCEDAALQGAVTPDLTFSIVCFILNGMLAVCFSARSVRYENSGLLVCHLITVLLQVSRIMYFVFTLNSDYLSGNMAICIEVLLVLNAFLLVVSCGTYPWVLRSFGWRTFMKGITRLTMLRLRRRNMYVQSCVQLDVIVTLNAFVALFILANSQAEHISLFILMSLSFFMAMCFIPMLRRHMTVFLIFFALTAAVSFTFQCYIVSSAVEEYFIRHAAIQFRESSCYRNLLKHCLWDAEIRIVPCPFMTDNGCRILNGSNTYISSNVNQRDYFEIYHCNITCFRHREHDIKSHISQCCIRYGNCRLRDATRSYSAVHLGVLTAIMASVRILLIHLWCRTEDDADEGDSSGSTCTRLCNWRQQGSPPWCASLHNTNDAMRNIGSLSGENDRPKAKVTVAREGESSPADAAEDPLLQSK